MLSIRRKYLICCSVCSLQVLVWQYVRQVQITNIPQYLSECPQFYVCPFVPSPETEARSILFGASRPFSTRSKCQLQTQRRCKRCCKRTCQIERSRNYIAKLLDNKVPFTKISPMFPLHHLRRTVRFRCAHSHLVSCDGTRQIL